MDKNYFPEFIRYFITSSKQEEASYDAELRVDTRTEGGDLSRGGAMPDHEEADSDAELRADTRTEGGDLSRGGAMPDHEEETDSDAELWADSRSEEETDSEGGDRGAAAPFGGESEEETESDGCRFSDLEQLSYTQNIPICGYIGIFITIFICMFYKFYILFSLNI